MSLVKSDRKNLFSNLLAIVIVILTAVQGYLDAAGGDLSNVNWTSVIVGVIVALGLYFTGKDKDLRPKEYDRMGVRILPVILLLALPFAFMSCSSVQTNDGNDNDSVFVEVGVDQLEDIIHLYYNGCQNIQVYLQDGGNADAWSLAMDLFTPILSAVNDAKDALVEIKNLNDQEIIYLANLSEGYVLGKNKKTYEQVCKLLLFTIQSRYKLFKKHNDEINSLHQASSNAAVISREAEFLRFSGLSSSYGT